MSGCLIRVLLYTFVLPFLFALVYFNVATLSLSRLGLSPEAAVIVFFAALAGSLINLPLSHQRVVMPRPRPRLPWLFHRPPVVTHTVVAINLGGAVVPLGMSAYLLPHVPLVPALGAFGVVTVVTHLLARPVPGQGIMIPALVPPVAAAVAALVFAGPGSGSVAYVAGTLGTLVGADLLNLPRLPRLGAMVMSIGGAGVFDGVFLVGIIAALLT